MSRCVKCCGLTYKDAAKQARCPRHGIQPNPRPGVYIHPPLRLEARQCLPS